MAELTQTSGSTAPDARCTENPRFSIVMPAYNAEATLARAIESVLGQTYTSWELIVVDDGSTDSTGEIARGYADRESRVRAIWQANRGCAAARAEAASHALGEFVTKLDADDVLLPHALEMLSDTIEAHPDFDIYSATGFKVYPDGSRTEALPGRRFLRSQSLHTADLIDDCWIFGGAASIRRETLERIGGFREDVWCEDYDLWLRALTQGARHLYVPEHIYLYSMGLEGRMNERPVRSFRSYIAILDRLEAEGAFSEQQLALKREAVTKFRERIRQLEETGTTDADFTDAQARRFRASVKSFLGEKAAQPVLAVAARTKWIAKPLRVLFARRARLRAARHSEKTARPQERTPR